MRYDPGADRTVICSKTWRKLGAPKLSTIPDFSGYPHAKFPIRGEAIVTVTLGKEERYLPIAVAYVEQAEDLFGLDWIESFDLIPKDKRIQVCQVVDKTDTSVEKDRNTILSKFKELFTGNGRVRNFQANVKVKDNCVPVIARSRTVPFAWKKMVNEELDRLVSADIIEPIDTMEENIEWASAQVIQMKDNGKYVYVETLKTL